MKSIEAQIIPVVSAVVINFIAGLLVYFITTNLIYALITIGTLELLIIIALLLRAQKCKSIIGVRKSFRSFDEAPKPLEMIHEVTSEFRFMGISAKTLLIDEAFDREMIQKARGSCHFKFLLLNPQSKYVKEKAIEEGDTPIGWKNEIEASIERLHTLRDQHHLNLEIRLFDSYPIFRIILVNSIMYFSWYPSGRRGSTSPMQISENINQSMYEPFSNYFNKLWEICPEK